MKPIIAIYSVGNDLCTFSGKKGDGALVSFSNGQIQNKFLSWVSIRKLSQFQFGEKNEDSKGGSGDTETEPGQSVRNDS